MLSNLKLMPKVLILSGQTATGKTRLAEILAKKYNGELISVDSRQIYSGLNIGTGKDHHPTTTIHLVDILMPSKSFSAVEFSQRAKEKIEEIVKKKQTANFGWRYWLLFACTTASQNFSIFKYSNQYFISNIEQIPCQNASKNISLAATRGI